MWSVAVLCGSIVAACSGTIETPTEEFPPRQGGSRTAAVTADDNDAPPRAPAAREDDEEDDEETPAAPADEEEETPAAPADEEETPAAPADEEEPPAAATLSFSDDIHPIFEANCSPCHAGGGAGGQDIAAADIEQAFQDAVDFEERVIATLESGSMPFGCDAPPGSGGTCVSEEDFEAIQDWYEAGAPE